MEPMTDATREVAKLRFLRDAGDISEREYVQAGVLLFGDDRKNSHLFFAVLLLIVLNLLAFAALIIVILG